VCAGCAPPPSKRWVPGSTPGRRTISPKLNGQSTAVLTRRLPVRIRRGRPERRWRCAKSCRLLSGVSGVRSPHGVLAEWRSSVVLAGLISRRPRVRIPPPQRSGGSAGRAPPRHGGGPWFDPRSEHSPRVRLWVGRGPFKPAERVRVPHVRPPSPAGQLPSDLALGDPGHFEHRRRLHLTYRTRPDGSATEMWIRSSARFGVDRLADGRRPVPGLGCEERHRPVDGPARPFGEGLDVSSATSRLSHVAQLAGQRTVNPKTGGSSPPVGAAAPEPTWWVGPALYAGCGGFDPTRRTCPCSSTEERRSYKAEVRGSTPRSGTVAVAQW
jgi:hypothetical protein